MYIYAIYGLFTRVDLVGFREEDAQKVSNKKNTFQSLKSGEGQIESVQCRHKKLGQLDLS